MERINRSVTLYRILTTKEGKITAVREQEKKGVFEKSVHGGELSFSCDPTVKKPCSAPCKTSNN